MNKLKIFVWIALITTMVFGCSGVQNKKIICNQFKIDTKIQGSILTFFVKTDLPDETNVMVSVYRTYVKKGNPNTYVVDYFSESSTIGKWKTKNKIAIRSKDWRLALKSTQDELSKGGLGFDVESIGDKLVVDMVVPVNQTDPKFGDRNQYLFGKAVTTEEVRIVKDTVEIYLPLN